jgi:hypothetical protein
MNYYDLLKNYVSTGNVLNYYQLNKIGKNRSLVGSYFNARNKFFERGYVIMDSELKFIRSNPWVLKKINIKSIVATMRSSGDKDEVVMLLNYIIDERLNDLSYDLGMYLVPHLYLLDRERLVFLYEHKPELLNSFYGRFILYHNGIIDKEQLDSVVIYELSRSAFRDLFNNSNRNRVEDALKNISTYFKDVYTEEDWGKVFKYVNDENKDLLKKIIDRRASFNGGDTTNLSLFNAMNRWGFFVEKNSLVNTANEVIESTRIREFLNNVRNDLEEYYGKVIELSADVIKLEIDLVKFEDAILDTYYCGDNKRFVMSTLLDRPGFIKKPATVIPEFSDIEFDEVEYNELLNKNLIRLAKQMFII